MIKPDCEHPEEAVRPNSKRFAREVVMQYLFSCEAQKEMPSAATFDECFALICDELGVKESHFSRQAREFATELYTQVAVHREEIDQLLMPLCEKGWGWNRISQVDRNIMRVCVAEMLYFPAIPDIVSIDEAVEIGGDFSGSAGGSFINGVLNSLKNKLEPAEKRGKKK